MGNRGLSDAEQLGFAARERRALMSANVRHFVALGRDAIRDGRGHAGIVLCPASLAHGTPGQLAAALARLAATYPAGLDPYDVVYL